MSGCSSDDSFFLTREFSQREEIPWFIEKLSSTLGSWVLLYCGCTSCFVVVGDPQAAPKRTTFCLRALMFRIG